ncbi:MAG: mechanosensitive ion channel family protein [Chloroflexota bacterium]|nr:MAG: mechanosensitive ion channel family protein [Chloroflexota bacterium]
MIDRISELADSEVILNWLATTGLNILIIITLSVIGYWLLTIATRQLTRHMQKLDDEEDSHFDLRIETIRRLVNTTALVIIVAVASLTILSELGINIGPLLASVGVASLALGLGAQSLVKDAIAGFFIIVEGQYQVGDVVELGGHAGNVEDLTLRVTQIRDSQGYLHFVPNGEIRVVTNRTRDWSRAIVDVGIAYDDDVALAVRTLDEIGELAAGDPEIGPLLLEAPTVTGIEGLDEWQVRLRVIVKTAPNEHWIVQRYYRRQVRLLFPERGLTLPSPRQEVVLKKAD